MVDEKVVPMPGTEEEPQDKTIDLERLSRVLDAAKGALGEAVCANLSPEDRRGCLDRAKRLQGELAGTLEALELNLEPDPVMVRVIGVDGKEEQHEVTFPIYAKGENGAVRRIDDEMIETVLMLEQNWPKFTNRTMIDRRVDFLDQRGSDYWLGRGEYKLSEDVFDAAMSIFVDSVLEVAGIDLEKEEP